MLAALLTAVLTLAAQDAPAGAAAPADAAALMAEYDALKAEYGKYGDEFWKSVEPDADGALHLTDEQIQQMPDTVFGPRFLALAERAGKTPAGCKALVMALRMVRDEPEAIARKLVDDFLDTPELQEAMPYFGGLRWGIGSDETEKLLRRVSEGSPEANVKLAARFELAQLLMDPAWSIVDGKPVSAPRSDTAPARALLVELSEQRENLDYARRATGMLFELDHLQVGMLAPDFEAPDQDGVTFKLSDYRGKVVLLDFWGFW
jgi:AhpC/TSA family